MKLLLIVFYLISTFSFSQQKSKDTSITWLDDIDIALLNSQGTRIAISKSPDASGKYALEQKQLSSSISNAQMKIDDANSKMLQNANNTEKYNQASQEKYNAQYEKEHAEWNQQSNERMSNAYNMAKDAADGMAAIIAAEKAKDLELAHQSYTLGKWSACISYFERVFKNSTGKIMITPEDWCLLARAGKRAIEKNQTLNMKQSPFEWNFSAYTNTFVNINKLPLSSFQKSELINEIFNWYPTMYKNLPDENSKAKYSKWFLDTFYGYISDNEVSIKLSKLPELIESIEKCIILNDDSRFYNDLIYALEHERDRQYIGVSNGVKSDWQIPKENPSSYILSTDVLFLSAACYQEKSGNKAQALEVWLNYLDYANFDIGHKALALYYGLALEKVSKLKTEVGAKALPHVNHNWGIKKFDLEKKSEDKKKDEQRTKSGLDWGDDEKK